MELQDVIARHCQAKAVECVQMAEISGSREIAEMYRTVARRWLEAAVKAETADPGTPNMGTISGSLSLNHFEPGGDCL
jgi:hypothetical protein